MKKKKTIDGELVEKEGWCAATPAQIVSQMNWRGSKWFEMRTKIKPFFTQPTLTLFTPFSLTGYKLRGWQTFCNPRLCLCFREVEWTFQSYKTHFIRPLLSLHRTDSKKLCSFWALPLYPDKTNQQLTFQRNRVRKQLLPALRYFFNPQLEKALFQLSEMIASEHKFLEGLTTQLWFQTGTVVYIAPSMLLALPQPLSRRMIKKGFQNSKNPRTCFLRVESLLVRTKEQVNSSQYPSLSFQIKDLNNLRFEANKTKKEGLVDQPYILFYPKWGVVVEKG